MFFNYNYYYKKYEFFKGCIHIGFVFFSRDENQDFVFIFRGDIGKIIQAYSEIIISISNAVYPFQKIGFTDITALDCVSFAK